MWTVRLKDAPQCCRHPPVAINSKIYVIGVYRTEGPISVSILDTETNQWDVVQTQRLPDGGPGKIFGFTVVAYGKYAYLWGGMDTPASRADTAVYRLDTNSMEWSRPVVSGEEPTLLVHHSACLVGHRMYILGGKMSAFPQQVHFLDLDTMKWHLVFTTGQVPRCPAQHRACAIGTRIFVWGGMLLTAAETHTFEYSNSVFYLETATATWVRPQVKGAPPAGRYSHSQFVYKGEIYILGGLPWRHDTLMRDIYKYNPESSQWTLVATRGSSFCARKIYCCCLIGDRVFVFSEFVEQGLWHTWLPSGVFDEYHFKCLTHVHVLDFAPTLKLLCQVAFMEARLDLRLLPLPLRNEMRTMTTDDSHPLQS